MDSYVFIQNVTHFLKSQL